MGLLNLSQDLPIQACTFDMCAKYLQVQLRRLVSWWARCVHADETYGHGEEFGKTRVKMKQDLINEATTRHMKQKLDMGCSLRRKFMLVR